MITWLRAYLYATRPRVTSLPPLELADHITVGRQNLQKVMVPRNPSSPAQHIRVLWGVEKLPYSYANKTDLDGHVVAFSRDIVAGNTPTETVADHEVANLRPHEASIT